jgi:hypothetical protein
MRMETKCVSETSEVFKQFTRLSHREEFIQCDTVCFFQNLVHRTCQIQLYLYPLEGLFLAVVLRPVRELTGHVSYTNNCKTVDDTCDWSNIYWVQRLRKQNNGTVMNTKRKAPWKQIDWSVFRLETPVIIFGSIMPKIRIRETVRLSSVLYGYKMWCSWTWL